MKPLTCLIVFAGLSAGAPALADCRVSSIGVVGGQVSATYEGLSNSALVVNTPLNIAANGDCRRSGVVVSILPDGASSQPIGSTILLQSGKEVLSATLRTGRASQPRSAASDEDDRDEIPLGVTGGGLNSELILTVAAGQNVSPGEYRTRVRLAASGMGERAGDPVDIVVRVRPYVGLAAASGTTLDLGVLSSGTQAVNGVTFRTYANTPYKIVLISDNNWKLKRSRTAPGDISYDPILSGVPLTAGNERVARLSNVASGSETLQFNARVGDMPRVAAGRYSDWVTVRISAELGN